MVKKCLWTIVLVGLSVIAAVAVLGREPTGSSQLGCFWRHVAEAKHLNEQRLSVYRQASGGASLPVSYALIASEFFLLPVAAHFDRRAEELGPAASTLLCQGLMPMASAPSPDASPAQGRFDADVGRAARERIAAQRKAQPADLEGLILTLRGSVDDLKSAPSYHCMQRHVTESSLRMAELGLQLMNDLRDAGQRESFGAFLADLLHLHLDFLDQAGWADDLAAQVQRRGQPIICHDVPSIPEWIRGTAAGRVTH